MPLLHQRLHYLYRYILNKLFCILQLFGLGLLGIGIWLKVDREFANLGEVIRIGTEEVHIVEIAAWVFIGAGLFFTLHNRCYIT